MSNTNTPFGFQEYYGGSGGVPTFAQSRRKIRDNYATAIFRGDPVMPVVSTATGYIVQGSPGTTRIDGIFAGCKYLSTALGRTVWSNYYPGSGATDDVEAYVIDDPNAQFKCMGASTTFNITGTLSEWTSSTIGQYAQFAIGTGNTASQQSGAYLNSVNTTVTFPFIVRDLIVDPPGANGTDPLSAYNLVVVGFNNENYRANGAGPTGIS